MDENLGFDGLRVGGYNGVATGETDAVEPRLPAVFCSARGKR